MNPLPTSDINSASGQLSSFFDKLTTLLETQNESLYQELDQKVRETAVSIIEAPQASNASPVLLKYPSTLEGLRTFYERLSPEEKTVMRSSFSYLIESFKSWLSEFHWIKESFIKFNLEIHGGDFSFSIHGAPMGALLSNLIEPFVKQNTVASRGALHFFLTNILKITDKPDAVFSSREKNLELIHQTSPYFKEFILSICKKNESFKPFKRSSTPAVIALMTLAKGTISYFSKSIEHFFQDDKEILCNTEMPVCLIRNGIYQENVNVYFNEVGFPSFCDFNSHNKFDILIQDPSTKRVRATPDVLKKIALALENNQFTNKCLIVIYAHPITEVSPPIAKPYFEVFAKNTSLVTSQVVECLKNASTLAWYETRISSYPYESFSDIIKTHYHQEPRPEPKKLQNDNTIQRREDNDFRMFVSFGEFKTYFLNLDTQDNEKVRLLLSTFFNLYNLWLLDSPAISYFKHCFEIFGGYIALSLCGKAIFSLLEKSFTVLQDNNTFATRSAAYYFYRHVLRITDTSDPELSSFENNLTELRRVSLSFTNIVLRAAKNNPIKIDPVTIKSSPAHAAIHLVREALTYFKKNINHLFTPSQDILSNTKIPVSLFSKHTKINLDTMIFSYNEAGFPYHCDLKKLNSFDNLEIFPATRIHPTSKTAYFLRIVADEELQKLATAFESNKDLISKGKALILFHALPRDSTTVTCPPYFELFAKNTGLSTPAILDFLKNSHSLFWKRTSFINYINLNIEKCPPTNKRILPAEKKELPSQDAKKSKSVNSPNVSVIPLKSMLYEPRTFLEPRGAVPPFHQESANGKLELDHESLLRRVSNLSSSNVNVNAMHLQVFRNAFAQLDALRPASPTQVKPLVREPQPVNLQKGLPIGIPNIGNSCYINAALHTIFNIAEFNNLLKRKQFYLNLQDILESEINVLVRKESLEPAFKTLINQFLFELQNLYLKKIYINNEKITFKEFFSLALQQIKEPLTAHQNNILSTLYIKAVPELQLKLQLDSFSETYSRSLKSLLPPKAYILRDTLFLNRFAGDKTAMQDASEVLEKLLPTINVKADLIKRKYRLETEALLGRIESQTISLIPISLPLATPLVNSNWTLQNIFDLAFSKTIMQDKNPLQIEEGGQIIAETSTWVEKLSLENPSTSHLVFQLKRYSQTGSSYEKNPDPFLIPEDYIIDLSLAFDAPAKTFLYKIKGVIYHHDMERRPDSGHFTTVIEKEGSWIHFDDEKTSFVNPKDFIEKGYLLILEKVS